MVLRNEQSLFVDEIYVITLSIGYCTFSFNFMA